MPAADGYPTIPSELLEPHMVKLFSELVIQKFGAMKEMPTREEFERA